MQISSAQWIKELRGIGKSLLDIIPSIAGSADASIKLRRGASGDQTFYIDEMAEKIIIDAFEKISRNGINFTLISEECGIKRFGADSDLRILIDPIDGSNNAKRGVPYYGTSIAILDGERLKDVLVGYVVDLSSKKEYWAVRGEGAWCNGEEIECHGSEGFDMVAFEASAPARDIERLLPILKSSRKVRCLGSIALDLALMGAGAIDVAVIGTPSRSFDYAAGMLILKEAGGIITDMKGRDIGEISAGIERTVPLIASSNKILHQKAITLIKESGL